MGNAHGCNTIKNLQPTLHFRHMALEHQQPCLENGASPLTETDVFLVCVGFIRTSLSLALHLMMDILQKQSLRAGLCCHQTMTLDLLTQHNAPHAKLSTHIGSRAKATLQADPASSPDKVWVWSPTTQLRNQQNQKRRRISWYSQKPESNKNLD